MDAIERIALQYLTSQGFTDVCYEPDGRVPPDFLVSGQIAVEVRMLNQREPTGDNPRGLEQVDIPLRKRMFGLAATFGEPKRENWLLYYRFARPVERWKTLGPRIGDWLNRFVNTPEETGREVDFGRGFSIVMIKRSGPANQLVEIIGNSDEDSGCSLIAEIQRTVQLCISEKTKKIASVRSKYPEWWLILVDHMGYSLTDFERDLFKSSAKLNHTWDKVLLVNPRDPAQAFEV